MSYHMTGVFMRTGRATAAAVALLATLAACSSDEGSGIPEADGAPTASASATPTPTAPTTQPTADGDTPPSSGVVLGANPASGADEQAVVDAVLAYWNEVYRTYEQAEVDRTALAAVARGAAFQGPADYAALLQRRDVRQQGGAILGVQSVEVDGRSAEVVSCFRNEALNFDADGEPAAVLMPFFVVRNVVTQQGPDWRVSRSITISENQRCDFR